MDSNTKEQLLYWINKYTLEGKEGDYSAFEDISFICFEKEYEIRFCGKTLALIKYATSIKEVERFIFDISPEQKNTLDKRIEIINLCLSLFTQSRLTLDKERQIHITENAANDSNWLKTTGTLVTGRSLIVKRISSINYLSWSDEKQINIARLYY